MYRLGGVKYKQYSLLLAGHIFEFTVNRLDDFKTVNHNLQTICPHMNNMKWKRSNHLDMEEVKMNTG